MLIGKVTDEEFTDFSDVLEVFCKMRTILRSSSFNAPTSYSFQYIHNLVHQLYNVLLINELQMFLDIIWELYFYKLNSILIKHNQFNNQRPI